jgi:hypothetical protein
MSRNLNSEFKTKRVIPVIHRSMGSRDRRVYWDTTIWEEGCGLQIMLIISYQIELDKLNIYKTLTRGILHESASPCLVVSLYPPL